LKSISLDKIEADLKPMLAFDITKSVKHTENTQWG
jgi:hypothetical protein